MNCNDYHWGKDEEATGPLGIDYIYIDNCLLPDFHIFIIFLMFLWSAYLMNLMANTASDYLSPTLGFMCDKLNIAYDIAGITLLAFGNGAPDFFSLVASVSGGIDILIAIGALLGGGVFISTVVVGSIALLCPCEVSKRIFFRDVFFLMISTSCVLLMSFLEDIHFWFAILLYGVYFIYIMIVIFASLFNMNGTSSSDFYDRSNSISGDIVLTRFDNNSIQTAFWHRDAFTSKENTNKAITKTTTSSSAAAATNPMVYSKDKSPGGYSFMILNDSDDEADDDIKASSDIGGGDKLGNDGKSNATINLSGGFAPEFDNVIQEDYYCVSNNSLIQNNMYGNPLLATTTNDSTLEESLLSVYSSSDIITDDDSYSNPPSQDEVLKYNASRLRKRNKNRYESILTSLYWQQWMLKRRFQKSTLVTEWHSYSWWYRIYILVHYPLVVLRDISIPSLDHENWSKYHAMLHPLIDPIFLAFVTGCLNDQTMIIDLPVWEICLFIGIITSITIYFFTKNSRYPANNQIFTTIWIFFAFIMCIAWIYILAGELVTCLSALGNILGISPAFLGLTVLAWCNCMGDFFTNIAVAKQGLGEMAIAGCYGGPVFDILIGLATALSYATYQSYPKPYKVQLDTSCMISIVFIYIALVSTFIVVAMNGFKVDRFLGLYLISLYFIYTITQILLVTMK